MEKEIGFIERVSLCLKDMNLTRADLARELNTSQSTIFSWFRNGSIPSFDYAIKISNILNVSLDWLATGKGDKVKSENIDVYIPIKSIWDKLSECNRQELLNFGNYLISKK